MIKLSLIFSYSLIEYLCLDVKVYLACLLRFADWRWADLSAQKLVRRAELSATTKLSSGDETPPIANVLLSVVLLSTAISLSFCFLLHRVSLLQVQVFPLKVEHTFQIVHEVLSLVHTNRQQGFYLNVPKIQPFLL